MSYEHPVITEYRQMISEKMPDCLDLMIYFNWDEGPYAEELSKITTKFHHIEEQFDKTVWGDKASQFLLKQQLIELIPRMEIIYRVLVSKISQEDWKNFQAFKESHKKEQRFHGRE